MIRLVAVAVCVAGCVTTSGAGKGGNGPRAADYYPLAVGNAWSYQLNLLSEKHDLEVAIVKEEGGFFVDSHDAKLAVDAFGVRDQKRYLLREPIELGTAWTNVVSVSSIERYKIVGVGASCEVPAGHFENCVTVESSNRVEEGVVLTNEMTFAPKVGMVKVATVLETKGRQVPQSTMVLTKFTPAAAP